MEHFRLELGKPLGTRARDRPHRPAFRRTRSKRQRGRDVLIVRAGTTL